MQPDTGKAGGDPVKEPRSPAPQGGILAVALPAGDELEALVELAHQGGDLTGVVLAVAVECDDDVAGAVLEARPERRRLAEVSAQPNQAHGLVLGGEAFEELGRAVGRAVVDEDHLPRKPKRVARTLDLGQQLREPIALVQDGHDHRQLRRPRLGHLRRWPFARHPGHAHDRRRIAVGGREPPAASRRRQLAGQTSTDLAPATDPTHGLGEESRGMASVALPPGGRLPTSAVGELPKRRTNRGPGAAPFTRRLAPPGGRLKTTASPARLLEYASHRAAGRPSGDRSR